MVKHMMQIKHNLEHMGQRYCKIFMVFSKG